MSTLLGFALVIGPTWYLFGWRVAIPVALGVILLEKFASWISE